MNIILGIDPGTRYSGYALIRTDGRQAALLTHGCLSLGNRALAIRVHDFFNQFNTIITHWQVTDIALETPFLGKNAQNFLKLGYLRGIIYLLSQQHALSVMEFAPRQVKCSVTGFGAASKQQVAYMIKQLFPHLTAAREDETDALAIALCGMWQISSQSRLAQNAKKFDHHCVL